MTQRFHAGISKPFWGVCALIHFAALADGLMELAAYMQAGIPVASHEAQQFLVNTGTEPRSCVLAKGTCYTLRRHEQQQYRQQFQCLFPAPQFKPPSKPNHHCPAIGLRLQLFVLFLASSRHLLRLKNLQPALAHEALLAFCQFIPPTFTLT